MSSATYDVIDLSIKYTSFKKNNLKTYKSDAFQNTSDGQTDEQSAYT